MNKNKYLCWPGFRLRSAPSSTPASCMLSSPASSRRMLTLSSALIRKTSPSYAASSSGYVLSLSTNLLLIFRQILSSVFGYQTHKLDIRHKSRSWSQQAYFLRSLFLPPAASDEDEASSRIHRVVSHRPRTKSAVFADVGSPSTAPHVDSRTPRVRHSPSLQLPRAIVISGLENTSLSSQRALAQVLAEKRISLDDFHDESRPQDGPHELNSDRSTCLPDDFILVYICLIDPRERPNLHHALVGPVNPIPLLILIRCYS